MSLGGFICSYFASPHPKVTVPSFSPSTLFLCYIPSRFALSLITIIIPSFFAFNNLQQSERMAARVGSFRHSFLEKSKERLLSIRTTNTLLASTAMTMPPPSVPSSTRSLIVSLAFTTGPETLPPNCTRWVALTDAKLSSLSKLAYP